MNSSHFHLILWSYRAFFCMFYNQTLIHSFVSLIPLSPPIPGQNSYHSFKMAAGLRSFVQNMHYPYRRYSQLSNAEGTGTSKYRYAFSKRCCEMILTGGMAGQRDIRWQYADWVVCVASASHTFLCRSAISVFCVFGIFVCVYDL